MHKRAIAPPVSIDYYPVVSFHQWHDDMMTEKGKKNVGGFVLSNLNLVMNLLTFPSELPGNDGLWYKMVISMVPLQFKTCFDCNSEVDLLWLSLTALVGFNSLGISWSQDVLMFFECFPSLPSSRLHWMRQCVRGLFGRCVLLGVGLGFSKLTVCERDKVLFPGSNAC